MGEKIREIDKFLASVTASGDNAMAICMARILLKEVYDEWQTAQSEH